MDPKGKRIGVEKAYNEELHTLFRSLKIIKLIKSRILRWTGHVGTVKFSKIII